MIRLVVDTNVLVSALIKAGGAEAKVVDLITAGAARICVPNPILEEYRGVLARPKFGFDGAKVEMLLREIKRCGIFVSPPARLFVSRDEADNRFLECAEAANAHFLITGNKRHFPSQLGQTRVLNARELIRVVNRPEAE